MSDRDEPYCEAQVGGMMCGRPVTKWGQQCDYHDPKQSDRDEQELRAKVKDLLFRPVHIDHNNVVPDSITITKDGLEYFTDELIKIIDQVSTRRAAEAVCAELKQIVDWDVPATYEQNGKTWQGLAIPRNLVRKRLSQLQPTKGSK